MNGSQIIFSLLDSASQGLSGCSLNLLFNDVPVTVVAFVVIGTS